jgi:hypothetical protein
MKALPKLHDIIKSLSQAEKKYVRNYIIFSSKGASNNVLHLYDEMNKVLNYDEPAFKKKHSSKPFIKNLAVNKVNLEEKVLFALFLFSKDETPASKVKIMIEQAKIAANRNASTIALRILNKAAALCTEHELFEQLIEVNNSIISFALLPQEELMDLITQKIELCNRLINIFEYQYRAKEYSHYADKHGHINLKETKNKINQLAALTEYSGADKALSIRAKGFYYLVVKENARLNNDLEMVYKLSMEVLNVYETRPAYLSTHRGAYQKLIFDCIRFNVWQLSEKGTKNKQKLRDELEVLMHKMDVIVKMKFNRPEDKQTAELTFLQAHLYYMELIQTKDLQDSYYKVLLKRLTVNNFDKLTFRLGHFLYSIAAALMIRKKTALSLSFNNAVLSERKETFTKDTLYFSHFLRLMIHFDLGNYTLIENLLRSTERFLKLNNYYNNGEREILKMFRLLTTSPAAEHKKILQTFKSLLPQLKITVDFQFDHDFYRLEMWLEQKLK